MFMVDGGGLASSPLACYLLLLTTNNTEGGADNGSYNIRTTYFCSVSGEDRWYGINVQVTLSYLSIFHMNDIIAVRDRNRAR